LLIPEIGHIEIALHDLSEVDVGAGRQVQLLMEGVVETRSETEGCQVPLQGARDCQGYLEERVDVSQGRLDLIL